MNRTLESDIDAVLSTIKKLKVKIIVAPASSTRKGLSLENLLEADSKERNPYITGTNIAAVVVSSTALSNSICEELSSLDINTIVNLYGSTELFPLAVGCPLQPRLLHISNEMNHVEVVSSSGSLIKEGEFGLVRASRVGAIDHNKYRPSRSTGLVNYLNGDRAQLVSVNCECGFAGPSLSNVMRYELVEEKLQSGCQEW